MRELKQRYAEGDPCMVEAITAVGDTCMYGTKGWRKQL